MYQGINNIQARDSAIGSQSLIFYAQAGEEYCVVIDDEGAQGGADLSNDPDYAWIINPGGIFRPFDRRYG